jgi:hypothetical protein
MRLADLADRPLLDQLQGAAEGVRSHPLTAHLRYHFLAAGEVTQRARLAHVVRDGLLHVHVLAAFHGRHADHGVRVHRSRHDHGVDLSLHLVEQLAEVVLQMVERYHVPLELAPLDIVPEQEQRIEFAFVAPVVAEQPFARH